MPALNEQDYRLVDSHHRPDNSVKYRVMLGPVDWRPDRPDAVAVFMQYGENIHHGMSSHILVEDWLPVLGAIQELIAASSIAS
jgi:hypothetical protein